jgi:drug/metabolite transporter (DMT)-like permease
VYVLLEDVDGHPGLRVTERPTPNVAGVDQTHLRRGIICGIAAAVTLGASAPLATRLVDDVNPQLLAGLLYGGAAIALAPLAAGRRGGAETRCAAATCAVSPW